jgi:CBS domain-containing protein
MEGEMRVGKLCKRDVVTVRKNHSLVEAARRMRDLHVGDVVVVEGDRDIPIGILTDRDIVVGVIAKDPPDLAKLEVRDVLTTELITARADEDVEEVLDRMKRHRIRRIPVVDVSGSLVGIFTVDDLLALVSKDFATLTKLVSAQRAAEAEKRP